MTWGIICMLSYTSSHFTWCQGPASRGCLPLRSGTLDCAMSPFWRAAQPHTNKKLRIYNHYLEKLSRFLEKPAKQAAFARYVNLTTDICNTSCYRVTTYYHVLINTHISCSDIYIYMSNSYTSHFSTWIQTKPVFCIVRTGKPPGTTCFQSSTPKF